MPGGVGEGLSGDSDKRPPIGTNEVHLDFKEDIKPVALKVPSGRNDRYKDDVGLEDDFDPNDRWSSEKPALKSHEKHGRVSSLEADAIPRRAVSQMQGALSQRPARPSFRGMAALIKREIKARVNKEKLVRQFNLKMVDAVLRSLVRDHDQEEAPPDEEELTGEDILKAQLLAAFLYDSKGLDK